MKHKAKKAHAACLSLMLMLMHSLVHLNTNTHVTQIVILRSMSRSCLYVRVRINEPIAPNTEAFLIQCS